MILKFSYSFKFFLDQNFVKILRKLNLVYWNSQNQNEHVQDFDLHLCERANSKSGRDIE